MNRGPTQLLWTLEKNDHCLTLTDQPAPGGAHLITLYEDDLLVHTGTVTEGDMPLLRERWRTWFEGAGWRTSARCSSRAWPAEGASWQPA